MNSIVPEGVSDKEADRVTYSKDYWPITLRWLLDGKLPAPPDYIVWPENVQLAPWLLTGVRFMIYLKLL